VLSDGFYYRVGGHQPIKANVRVIAATHQHLEERVKAGHFREDLFHRLNVIRLRLPALRERSEDIPLLARFFLSKSAAELGVEAKRLSDEAMAKLAAFSFPGNVRQLENLCHWMTVMAPGALVEANDLPPELNSTEETPPKGADWLSALGAEISLRLGRGDSRILDELTPAFERMVIERALLHTGGKRIEAAELLGWGRNTLTRKIQELGMEQN
jgi:two-component system nitrogen regulation response regulator GlnG